MSVNILRLEFPKILAANKSIRLDFVADFYRGCGNAVQRRMA
jgi:hypothetical protein